MSKFNFVILIILFLSSLLSAKSQDDFYEKFYEKNFSGYKGIVFICSFDSTDKTLEKISKRAITDIELICSANKINLKVINNNDHYSASYYATLNQYLLLQYYLMATNTEGQYEAKAVFGELSFEIFYSNAIEKYSTNENLNKLARSGYLTIWSKTIIGSGSSFDIITPFSSQAETVLKMAMTLFLKNTR